MSVGTAPIRKGVDYLWTGILGAVLAMLVAYLLLLVHPNTRGQCYDGAAYTCLWFMAIYFTAPFVSVALSLVLYLNYRRQRFYSESWLFIVSLAMVLAQSLYTASSLWMTRDSMHYLSYSEVAFVPQGFFGGAVTGMTYWVVLQILRSRRNAAASVSST